MPIKGGRHRTRLHRDYLATVPTPPNAPDGGFIASVNDEIALGQLGVFIALSKYNNTPNDDSVQVRMLPSQGFARIGCDDSDATDTKPRWEGCDLWRLAEVPDTGVYLKTETGWVTDGVLVVRHKEKITLQIGTLPLRVIGAVLTARIEDAGSRGGLRLVDGRIVGRIETLDLIQAAGEYVINLPQFGIVGPVCHFKPLQDDLVTKICAAQDIPIVDTQSRDLRCNALSMGFAFNAVAVPLGVLGVPAPPPACPPTDAHCDDD